MRDRSAYNCVDNTLHHDHTASKSDYVHTNVTRGTHMVVQIPKKMGNEKIRSQTDNDGEHNATRPSCDHRATHPHRQRHSSSIRHITSHDHEASTMCHTFTCSPNQVVGIFVGLILSIATARRRRAAQQLARARARALRFLR